MTLCRFFNLDAICDTSSEYPVMLPSCEFFAAAMRQLGISADDLLIVYDAYDEGIYFAPRVTWTLAYFGHKNVRVLNSFRLYVQGGYPQSLGPFSGEAKPDDFAPFPALDHVADTTSIICFEDLRTLVCNGDENYQILDSRPRIRFSGNAAGDGHMPGAVNVPMACLLDSTKSLLSGSGLRAALENAGVDEKKSAILSCNTGVTASVIWLALQVNGYGAKTRLYDGSWAEWKERATDPGLIVCDGGAI